MRTATAIACALLALACDRNIEPYEPGQEARRPDLSKIFPESDEPEAAQAPAAGAAPAQRGQRGAPPVAASDAPPIRGEVRLAGGLAAPAGSVLFVIARKAGVSAGPPLAVERIASPEFPQPFEIGPDDVMVPAFRFEGEIELSARLDTDGNATSRQPGDVRGRAPGPLRPGSEGVEIQLDEPL